VRELRRRLADRFAPPVFVRSFGPLTLHVGDWDAPGSVVTRRRVRLLLGLLVAARDATLARDQILDTLWPDADPAAALNSLNQSVFQLRRIFDAGYREGHSPQYVISTPDSVKLNPDLVWTDLRALRSLSRDLTQAKNTDARTALGRQLLDLVRGEFLADLRYEDWVVAKQMSVHADVRTVLLPLAEGRMPELGEDGAAAAGRVLMQLDPYDEAAHVAMVRSIARSGKRQQARVLLTEFATRMHVELDEQPSDRIRQVAGVVGLDLSSVEVD
jgi:DNA-binding SARP family transcriptional activator